MKEERKKTKRKDNSHFFFSFQELVELCVTGLANPHIPENSRLPQKGTKLLLDGK